MTDHPLLTPREVLDMLGLKSLRTIRRWRDAGKLQGVEISRKVFRYRREDVQDILDGSSAPPERSQDIEAHIQAAQADARRFRDRW